VRTGECEFKSNGNPPAKLPQGHLLRHFTLACSENFLKIFLKIDRQAPPGTLSWLLCSRCCDRKFAQKAGKVCWFKYVSSISNKTKGISFQQQNCHFSPKDTEFTGRNAKLHCIHSYTYAEGNHHSTHKSS